MQKLTQTMIAALRYFSQPVEDRKPANIKTNTLDALRKLKSMTENDVAFFLFHAPFECIVPHSDLKQEPLRSNEIINPKLYTPAPPEGRPLWEWRAKTTALGGKRAVIGFSNDYEPPTRWWLAK
ncbi:MAG: hypothetical protein ACE5I1_03895 [bacterium]